MVWLHEPWFLLWSQNGTESLSCPFCRRKVRAEPESPKVAGTKLLPAIHPQDCGFYVYSYLEWLVSATRDFKVGLGCCSLSKSVLCGPVHWSRARVTSSWISDYTHFLQKWVDLWGTHCISFSSPRCIYLTSRQMNPEDQIEGVCSKEPLFLPARGCPEASWDAS